MGPAFSTVLDGLLRASGPLLFGFVLLGLLYRVRMMKPAAMGPLLVPVLLHDAGLLGTILILAGIPLLIGARRRAAQSSRGVRLIGVVCRLAALAVGVIYMVDVLVYHFFGTRLYVTDVLLFRTEVSAGMSLVGTGWQIVARMPLHKQLAGTIGVVMLAFAVFGFLWTRHVRRHGAFVVGAGAVLAALHFVSLPMDAFAYGDKPLYENVVERNRNFFRNPSYSPSFRARLVDAPAGPTVTEPGQQRRLNIILVMVESLSSYHSQYFSGVHDWTPRLDSIARSHTAIPNFYANGWTTIGGVIALLGGAYPFVPENASFNEWGSPRFSDFAGLPETLPGFLASQGYATEFISAGDVSFMAKGSWLTDVGFDRVVSPEDGSFPPGKRGPFHSVPDNVLFERVREERAHLERSGKPYLLVVLTVWSHRPFLTPEAEADSEEGVMLFTDAQLAAFYQDLRQAGFFDDGMLMITGDHRAMEPFRRAEVERFGPSAAARVPAVIVTDAIELPSVIEEDFQQRDLFASVKGLVSAADVRGPMDGNFLRADPQPPACVVHARGDDRDLVYVRCGGREGVVRLDGDDTRFVEGGVADPDAVLTVINRSRLRPEGAQESEKR